jgi:hypothetical protein
LEDGTSQQLYHLASGKERSARRRIYYEIAVCLKRKNLEIECYISRIQIDALTAWEKDIWLKNVSHQSDASTVHDDTTFFFTKLGKKNESRNNNWVQQMLTT